MSLQQVCYNPTQICAYKISFWSSLWSGETVQLEREKGEHSSHFDIDTWHFWQFLKLSIFGAKYSLFGSLCVCVRGRSFHSWYDKRKRNPLVPWLNNFIPTTGFYSLPLFSSLLFSLNFPKNVCSKAHKQITSLDSWPSSQLPREKVETALETFKSPVWMGPNWTRKLGNNIHILNLPNILQWRLVLSLSWGTNEVLLVVSQSMNKVLITKNLWFHSLSIQNLQETDSFITNDFYTPKCFLDLNVDPKKG